MSSLQTTLEEGGTRRLRGAELAVPTVPRQDAACRSEACDLQAESRQTQLFLVVVLPRVLCRGNQNWWVSTWTCFSQFVLCPNKNLASHNAQLHTLFFSQTGCQILTLLSGTFQSRERQTKPPQLCNLASCQVSTPNLKFEDFLQGAVLKKEAGEWCRLWWSARQMVRIAGIRGNERPACAFFWVARQ